MKIKFGSGSTLAMVADMNEQAWEEQIKISWPKPSDPSFASSEPHKHMEEKVAPRSKRHSI